MIAHEGKVVLREVPAIVHGRPQEAVGTDHIKQCTDHLLTRTRGLTGSPSGGLKVFNDGSAVANHVALWGHQGWDGRQFASGEHLRLEGLVPR